jgi:hypothetical protein
MSSHRVPETRRAGAPRRAPARVSDFFDEAATLTRSGDAPFLREWTDWATQYETLDDAWRASRNPEFLIFMLGHAVRLQYVEYPERMLSALERFVTWCVGFARLDLEDFRTPDRGLESASPEWFSLTGNSLYGRARRAARAAECAAAGDGEEAPLHELLRERTEQAGLLKLFVGNPFYGMQVVECSVADATHDPVPALTQSEDSADHGWGADDGDQDDDVTARPELLLAPAHRGSWGVVTRLGGPPDPPGATGAAAAALHQADCSLRRGMILLAKKSADDYVAVAEECFRDALSTVLSTVGEMHPKMAYACDRVGLVCQIQGREEEAEAMYLRAIALRDAGAWERTLWDEVTLLNLAILYADQGRYGLRDAMLERLEETRLRDEGPGDSSPEDPDQLEFS